MTTKVAGFYISDLAYQPIVDLDPDFTAIIKDMHIRPVKESWNEALFSPEYWAELKNGLTEIGGFLSSFGPLRSLALVERKPLGPDQLYLYRMTYNEKSLLVSVTRNSSGKIVSSSAKED